MIPHGNCLQLSSIRVNWHGRTQADEKHKQYKANTHHDTRPYGQIKPYLNVGSASLLNSATAQPVHRAGSLVLGTKKVLLCTLVKLHL